MRTLNDYLLISYRKEIIEDFEEGLEIYEPERLERYSENDAAYAM